MAFYFQETISHNREIENNPKYTLGNEFHLINFNTLRTVTLLEATPVKLLALRCSMGNMYFT